MNRLNLTLDDSVWSALSEHARLQGLALATAARGLIQEALDRRNQLARHKQLAADYAADRNDTILLLAEIEGPQYELLGDEKA